MNPLKIHTGQLGAVIRITGEDAFNYLQSQFSNDLRNSIAQPVTYGLLLDRKGRIQADAFVLQVDPETFLAVSYRCPGDEVLAKLEENIIADDVELEDVTHQFDGFVLIGDSLNGVIEQAINAAIPSGSYAQCESSFLWYGRHSSQPNTDWLVPKTCAKLQDPVMWLQDKGFICERIDTAALERERIASLLPAIPIDLGVKDLPQEGGLESSAVSFNKGCYLGQEVMARLHSMGNVQRRLVRIKSNIQLKDPPLAVYLGDREVGEIRSVASCGAAWIGLALVKNRYVKAGTLLALEPNGNATLTVNFDNE